MTPSPERVPKGRVEGWPTRTQQIGLLILLSALAGLALVRACAASA